MQCNPSECIKLTLCVPGTMLSTGNVRDVQQEWILTSPELAYGLDKKHVYM